MLKLKIKREKINAVFMKHHLIGLPFDTVIHLSVQKSGTNTFTLTLLVLQPTF